VPVPVSARHAGPDPSAVQCARETRPRRSCSRIISAKGPIQALAVHRIPRIPTYNKYSPGPTLQKLLLVDPLLTAKLFRGISRTAFDVIHAHHYEGLLVGKTARAGRAIPLIYDAHTLLGSELPFFKLGLTKKFGARLGLRLDRSLPQLADHVVAVTQAIKDKLVAYVWRKIGSR
jgi:glycosyltransferase involved in cell wall biosynthesis